MKRLINRWVPSLPLEAKVASVLAVGSVAALIIGYIGYSSLTTMREDISRIVDETVRTNNLSLHLSRSIIQVDRAEKNIVLARDLDEIRREEKKLTTHTETTLDTLQQLRPLVDEPLRKKLSKIEHRFQEYTDVQQHIVELVKLEAGLKSQPTTTAAASASSSKTPSFSELETLIADYKDRCQHMVNHNGQLKDAVCRIVTQEISANLETLKQAKKNIIYSSVKPGDESVGTPAVVNSINQIYLRLDDLRDILGSRSHDSLTRFVSVLGEWLFHQAQLNLAPRALDNRKALSIFRTRGRKLAEGIREISSDIIAYNDAKLAADKKASSQLYRNATVSFIVITGLCILASFVFGFLILAQLTGRLKRLTAMARNVAQGNLGTRTEIRSNDQMGELAGSLNTMAEKIRGFTNELKNSRRKAEDANRMKSQFLANMSHEIRTPMNGVLGMTELLSMTQMGSVQRRYLERIRESGNVLMALVNDILDFSKIEAGKLDLDHTDFDLVKTLEDVVAILAHRAQSQNLELICDVDPNINFRVIGDPARLRQVALNLMSNAVKFTEKGEVALRAECTCHQAGSVELYLEVTDTGIGIDPETHKTLFKPFSQADTSTTRVYGGTGLGLAITKKLVELMGGAIRVDSTPGQGSRFTIQLQFAVAEPATQAAEGRPAAVPSRRVLVVEPHSKVQRVLTRHLENWGHEVTAVMNAPEALDAVQSARTAGGDYDLIFIEMDLPGMEGLELAQALASKNKTQARIIMLTPISLDQDTQARLEAPHIAAQLAKPIRREELYEAIAPQASDGSDESAETGVDTVEPVGRVLLAEDNAINQDVAVGLLGRCGYDVDIASTGIEAVSLFTKAAYNAIIMDVQMPEMDGYKAAAEIRSLEQDMDQTTPIIAMTASAFRGDREKCLASGMDDYIAKPVTLEKLQKVLGRHDGSSTDEPNATETGTDETADASSTADPKLPRTPSRKCVEPRSVDLSAVQQIRDLEKARPGFFHDMVNIFINSADEHLETLHESLENDDPDTLKKEAHFIKGSAGNFGANRVTDLCVRLETLARENRVAEARPLGTELKQEYEAVKAELTEMVAADGAEAERRQSSSS